MRMMMRIIYAHGLVELLILELKMKQTNVSKKATNISLPMDVYLSAKAFGINISQVCEQSLRESIRLEQEREWNEKNAAFIQAYNQKVEDDGVALAEWRGF